MFSLFIIVPILGGLYLSFTSWDITNGLPKWIGLANYRQMFHDPAVWQASLTTLKFIAFGVIPTVIISLWLAMLINFRFRLFTVVRSLYLIPAAMSFAASAVVWRYIFQDGPGYGILDYIITKLGVSNPPDWLASTTWALPALDIITIWLSLPIATVLYLAALQRIPDSVIEASTLDGCGPVRRIRYIIWPGVRYMTPLVAIVALLSFTNGSFDLVRILTQGDPHRRHPDADLLHLLRVVQLRRLGLRGSALGASGRHHRRHPARIFADSPPWSTDGDVSRQNVISPRVTRRIRIVVSTVIGLVMSAPLLYMLAGSLMSNSQLSDQPPVHPELAAFRQLPRRLHAA